MDAAHSSFAPDKAIMLIDPADKAIASFWREQNPEALAMVEGNPNSPSDPTGGPCTFVGCSPAISGKFK